MRFSSNGVIFTQETSKHIIYEKKIETEKNASTHMANDTKLWYALN